MAGTLRNKRKAEAQAEDQRPTKVRVHDTALVSSASYLPNYSRPIATQQLMDCAPITSTIEHDTLSQSGQICSRIKDAMLSTQYDLALELLQNSLAQKIQIFPLQIDGLIDFATRFTPSTVCEDFIEFFKRFDNFQAMQYGLSRTQTLETRMLM